MSRPELRTSTSRRRRPRGFTLVELLVVVVIIGILVALLVPAIANAVKTANNARVTGEINAMTTALAAFKDKYGEYPPSRILLSETGSYPLISDPTLLSNPSIPWVRPPLNISPTDITLGDLTARSLRYLRRFFPQAVIINRPSSPFPPGYFPDYNGNSVLQVGMGAAPTPDQGYIYLEGDECLAFFLGGIPSQTGAALGMSGFAKDPLKPFAAPGDTSIAPYGSYPLIFSSSRNAPFYDFAGGRLIDLDGDLIPSFMDPLHSGVDARPYAYFSAYGSNGYDPNDVNFVEPDENATVLASGRNYTVSFSGNGGSRGTFSFAPNPYTSTPPVPLTAGQAATFLKADSFQIVSAGADGFYGVAGQWLSDSTERMPYDAGIAAALSPPNQTIRKREQDNLTSFSSSKLD